MNVDMKQNTKKIRLKRYRGLLLSQSIDLTNYHEAHYPDHEIGTQAMCSVCRQYTYALGRIEAVTKMITSETRQSTLLAQQAALPKRRYYYVGLDDAQTIYVLRDQSMKAAQQNLPAGKRQHLRMSRVSEARAFQILRLLGNEGHRQRIDFLQQDHFFFGIVDHS